MYSINSNDFEISITYDEISDHNIQLIIDCCLLDRIITGENKEIIRKEVRTPVYVFPIDKCTSSVLLKEGTLVGNVPATSDEENKRFMVKVLLEDDMDVKGVVDILKEDIEKVQKEYHCLVERREIVNTYLKESIGVTI